MMLILTGRTHSQLNCFDVVLIMMLDVVLAATLVKIITSTEEKHSLYIIKWGHMYMSVFVYTYGYIYWRGGFCQASAAQRLKTGEQ